ncbi:hypothetical protein OF83DRAFT_1179857 [Amylostereum chailletii]|nr:hypothetical protein OF83DRAFT_1179857 [Amylostereum chailletii]
MLPEPRAACHQQPAPPDICVSPVARRSQHVTPHLEHIAAIGSHVTRPQPVASGALRSCSRRVLHCAQRLRSLGSRTSKKQKRVVFRLDPDQGQILWDSSKHHIIPIENIKELRSGVDARYYRKQFQLPCEYEARSLTTIYTLGGQYNTLQGVVAPSADVFQMWNITLRRLYAVRQALMSRLRHVEMHEAMWEKQY